MVIFIGGASHTGKTRLAQRLLERYGYPYLSIDHLKMGLIRSGYTTLTPQDVQGMSMREIRRLTESLAAGEQLSVQEDAQPGRHGGDGNGKGNRGNGGGAGQ